MTFIDAEFIGGRWHFRDAHGTLHVFGIQELIKPKKCTFAEKRYTMHSPDEALAGPPATLWSDTIHALRYCSEELR
jgi:hypothetical protein